jgi:DNA (cytosine-5)-methyltransferase 1
MQSKRPVVDKSGEDKILKITEKYGMFEPALMPWQTVRDALNNLPDPRSSHGISDHVFRDGARIYPGHTGSTLDAPAKTIKAGDHGVPGGENMIRFPDGNVRYLTVLEAKRLQTFPHDFVIKGVWGEAMRQIGNAVPVLLAETIGHELVKVLDAQSQGVATDGIERLVNF